MSDPHRPDPPADLLPEFHFRPLMHAYPSASAPPSLLDSGPRAIPRADAFVSLCPSARTSYTRVNFSGANTPRPPADLELEADDPIPDAAPDHDASSVVKREDEQLEPPVPQEPQVALTFLLISGRRRTMSFDPQTTVGRVKELAWNAWPSEWQDERPPAPSYLRVLYLGKILQDDDTLAKFSFPTYLPTSPATPPPSPTIVHLSIRSSAPAGADAAPTKKRRRRSSAADGAAADEDGAGCCACVIC